MKFSAASFVFACFLLFSSCKSVSFIETIEKENLTKDGIYLNGYVVNLSNDQVEELNGKTVRISGNYTVVKAITDKHSQGRTVNTKHIKKPKIKIVE